MISHVLVYLLTYGEKTEFYTLSVTHKKWAYSLSVCPIGCTPAFFHILV